jgi:hypothetical protein
MPTSQKILWAGLAVVAAAIIALAYFLFLAPPAEKTTTLIPDAPARSAAAPPAVAAGYDEDDPAIVPLDLDLDRSDAAVRELVAGQEVPAALKKWLQQKELVRTVVAVVDGIARGESPAPLLPFLAPDEKFQALEKEGKLRPDPKSFRRYDPLVSAFTTVPDQAWITWYRTLRPTLEKAFRELGYPGVTFAQRLRQASDLLLQTPPCTDRIVLERKIMSYAFADPGLEALPPAQKLMLRLGPGNAARVQKKLRALAARMEAGGKKE